MKTRYKLKKNLHSLFFHAALGVAALIVTLPLIWMVSASFFPDNEAATFPPKFIPSEYTLDQYEKLFTRLNSGRYFLNSLTIAAGVTLLSTIVNSMAGFAFAKFSFKGKNKIFALLVMTMIVPGQITMLPVFLILNKLGLLNSYFGIILPGMASAFGIFLVRQYLYGIPDSYIEAAKIDGANHFQIYWKLIIPLAKPILTTLGIFTFMGTWNDFMWPLIVMTKSDMYPLTVGLANLLGEHAVDTELMMAGAVITVLPVVIIFLALQKYYMKGLMLGGIKE